MAVCAELTSDFGGVGRRTGRVGRGDRGVELLLRDLFLRDERLEPLDVLRVLRRRRFAFALPRLRGDELRAAPPRPGCRRRRCQPAPLRGCPTPGRTSLRVEISRDRHAGAGRRGGGFGVGELGARAVDGDLVVARIDFGDHVAGLRRSWLSLTGDLDHRAADPGRHLRDVSVDLRVVGRSPCRPTATSRRRRRARARRRRLR